MSVLLRVPAGERPREKLLSRGADTLSDIELMAALLGTGTRGRGVFAVAAEVLQLLDRVGPDLTPDQLLELRGMGRAKAVKLIAAQEFFRRRTQPRGLPIRSPKDLMPHLCYLAAKEQEHFVCITLNGAQELMKVRVVTIGLVDCVQVHPREVFAPALGERAAAVIVAHNHPAQNLKPSQADQDITKRLRKAGELLGIPLLDHMIFNQSGYYSMRQEGGGGFAIPPP